MNSQTVLSLVIGLAVLALLIYRQVRRRRVRTGNRTFTLPLVLCVVGALDVSNVNTHHALTSTQWVHLAISLIVFGIGFGAWRAFTVRLWREDGALWRQGTWLTVALWLIAVAGHTALDGLGAVGSATLLLYLGVTLATQRIVMLTRSPA
ncbi:MAG: hypothetical protein OWT27_02410 [Firmicutes bacterium]|nr:hypothetical protein [Bacillota bacterium]